MEVAMSPIRPTILIGDDHTLVAEGIGKLLEERFDIVGNVETAAALVAAARELQPDLVIADISLGDMSGLEAARQIKAERPMAKIVFVTQHKETQYVREALRLGASGYVVKQSAGSDLIAALEDALAGRVYLSSSLSPQELVGTDNGDPLTPRQREVLRLVAEGHSAKEIAGILSISTKTVEFHKAAVMERLGVRSTAQLTRYAVEHHIVG
jgi:DNA-binding NarL/FixJ family response regulator